MITVLFPNTAFVYLYSGVPLFQYRDSKLFTFTSDPEFVASRDKNKVIILLRWFNRSNPHRPTDPVVYLQRLRDRYQTIVLFDDEDSTSSSQFGLLPYVDYFWKKQVLRDRSAYLKPLFGNRIFSEYYHRHHGVQDPEYRSGGEIGDPAQLAKLRVTWHLGIGAYPLRHWKDKLADTLAPVLGSSVSRLLAGTPRRPRSALAPKRSVCQARFASQGYSPTIGYQRQLFAERLQDHPGVLLGFIDRRVYSQEMATSLAVVSPFGWGEVCYRDFEAFQLGSVLIKPDMGHLESWPDCYRPGVTYVPVDWSGRDLLGAIDAVLASPETFHKYTENAWSLWSEAFDHTDARVEALIEEIL